MSSKSSKLKKAIILINSILLIIIILFSPLSHYIFNLDCYLTLYKNNGVFLTLNEDDVISLTKNLFNFFKYGESYKNCIFESYVRYTDKSISSVAFFRPKEINHLDDVRRLLSKIFIMYYASIILLIILIILLIERNIFNFIKNIENKTVSFFSLSKIKDLELIGFKYNFSNNKSLDYFIGVSNIVEKDIAMVSFSEGRLIMYIPFSV